VAWSTEGNRCEPSLCIASLRGCEAWTKKVCRQVQGLLTPLTQTLPYRRRGGTFPTLVHLRNVVSPLLSLWVGGS
jgi:hypothetical protein